MITKNTAYDIWIAYDEITKAEKLLTDLEELTKDDHEMNLRDCFGRQRGLQLGIPSGENGHRLFDVNPKLAVQVIKAHIANKTSELSIMQERARCELET
jgi:hypothetical protein